ncbi:MAG: hypothetical protein M3478_11775, partial [Planctomycetota bacterium]|nr:hypothetical protein [Planctomycetota bacterium]
MGGLFLVITLILAARSVWVSDIVRWRSIDATDHRSLVRTTFGLRSARLGLGFVYDQTIVSTHNPRDVDAALASPGLSHLVAELPARPTIARRFGFGFERAVDERPESFQNALEMAIPLWLIALLLAIGPARWLIARRAAAKGAGTNETETDDAASPRGFVARRRSTVKVGVIALVLGVLIGAAGVYFVRKGMSSPAAAPLAATTNAPAPAA